MPSVITWPRELLQPARTLVNPVAFSRGGGRTLGGKATSIRTDRGYWSIVLEEVSVYSRAEHQTWEAIRTMLSGMSGLIAVPAWSIRSAPYASGGYEAGGTAAHGDDSLFDDDTNYSQHAVQVRLEEDLAIGDTVAVLRIINAAPQLAGVRWSHDHALYATGRALDIAGDVWTVEITPAARAPIAAGSWLNFDAPTCLCRLASDRAMDLGADRQRPIAATVEFEEATDFWSDLAAGLIE